MYFRDPKKELPNIGSLVLIKLNYDFYYICKTKPADPYAYVYERSDYDENDEIVFVEASGEFYSAWTLKEVLGWMPIEELDSIEIK